MPSEELKGLLNRAVAREMQVSIQYMWNHVMAKGDKWEDAEDMFKETAITEMKHAEEIAERLFDLGDKPTIVPAPITISEDLSEVLRANIESEKEAIAMYKEIIEKAKEEGDEDTAELFEDVLEDEEEHLEAFTSLLEECK